MSEFMQGFSSVSYPRTRRSRSEKSCHAGPLAGKTVEAPLRCLGLGSSVAGRLLASMKGANIPLDSAIRQAGVEVFLALGRFNTLCRHGEL